MREVKFRGQSGDAYNFVQMAENAPWARETGVALFAAQGPFGWRVVRLVKLRGREDDVQPIWAFADAQRYAATTVFVHRETDPTANAAVLNDLEAGLSPLCVSSEKPLAQAA